MKLSKFFASFAIVLFLKMIESKNITLQHEINDEKLIKSICKIVNHRLNQTNHTQDVLIGNVKELNNFDVDYVAKCISHRNPVDVTDMAMKMTNFHLRKASFVIKVLNNIDLVV